jgi:hypothetical protein
VSALIAGPAVTVAPGRLTRLAGAVKRLGRAVAADLVQVEPAIERALARLQRGFR